MSNRIRLTPEQAAIVAKNLAETAAAAMNVGGNAWRHIPLGGLWEGFSQEGYGRMAPGTRWVSKRRPT